MRPTEGFGRLTAVTLGARSARPPDHPRFVNVGGARAPAEDRQQEGHDVGIQWTELDARPGPRVGASELTGPAVAALSPLVRTLPFEALTPVKQLLKRYFSDQPWTDADDDALAELVGAPAPAGPATERVELAPGLGARLGLARRRGSGCG